MFGKITTKIQTFINKYLSKKQQAYGVFIFLFLLATGILVFSISDSKEAKQTLKDKSNEPVQTIKKEEDTGKVGMKEETKEHQESFETHLENTKQIDEPLIESTVSILVDASPNYAIFIGHAGALSIYDKALKTYRQIDVGVDMATIENNERFVAYTKKGVFDSKLYNYRIDYPEVEEVRSPEGRFISDIKMHDASITYVHHAENTDDYTVSSAVPISEQEWFKPSEILPLNIPEVGKYLYQNEERVFFYDANGAVIKGIYVGLHQAKITAFQMSKDAKFALKDKDVYTIDKGVLAKNNNAIESGIENIVINGNDIYVTGKMDLYKLNDSELQLIESNATSAFANQYDLTFQHVDRKTYTKDFE